MSEPKRKIKLEWRYYCAAPNCKEVAIVEGPDSHAPDDWFEILMQPYCPNHIIAIKIDGEEIYYYEPTQVKTITS